MIARLASLLRCRSGATAAEFSLVLPLLLILLLGMIDVGRLMYTWNRAEKATQMGVRFAVATEMVAQDLANYSFVVDGGLTQGAPITAADFGSVTCDDTQCTCTTAPCPALGYNATAFSNIVDRMQAVMPEIDDDEVLIDYSNSGLGYAGDPNGPDIAPLVTVRLDDMDPFQPGTLLLFGATIDLPDFRAALTLEDGTGAISN